MSFTARGSRPRSAASRRMSATAAAVRAGVVACTNTHSALRAAKARPAGEVPAWNSTGVRCGDGGAPK